MTNSMTENKRRSETENKSIVNILQEAYDEGEISSMPVGAELIISPTEKLGNKNKVAYSPLVHVDQTNTYVNADNVWFLLKLFEREKGMLDYAAELAEKTGDAIKEEPEKHKQRFRNYTSVVLYKKAAELYEKQRKISKVNELYKKIITEMEKENH